MDQKVQFKLTFKSGPRTVAEVKGLLMDAGSINIGDVLDLERSVERVTGLRCHVEQVEK